jgi:KIF-binding protein
MEKKFTTTLFILA